jgi:hypothetical protein
MAFRNARVDNLDVNTINNAPYPPIHDGLLMVPTTSNTSFSIPLSSVDNGVASQLETANPGLTFNPATNLLEINSLHIGEIPPSTGQTGTFIDWFITQPLDVVCGFATSLNTFLMQTGGTAGLTDSDLIITNNSTVPKNLFILNESPNGTTALVSNAGGMEIFSSTGCVINDSTNVQMSSASLDIISTGGDVTIESLNTHNINIESTRDCDLIADGILSLTSHGDMVILPGLNPGTAGQALLTDGAGNVSWGTPAVLSTPIPILNASCLANSILGQGGSAGVQFLFSNSSSYPVDATNVTDNVASLFNYSEIQGKFLKLRVTVNAGPLTLGSTQTFRVILATYTTEPIGYSQNLQYLLTDVESLSFSDTDVNTLAPISKVSPTFAVGTANNFCFYFILDIGGAGWYAGAAMDISAQLLLI